MRNKSEDKNDGMNDDERREEDGQEGEGEAEATELFDN